jgi:hypothetical protein
MNRWSISIGLALICMLSCAALAQDSSSPNLFSSDLVAWSGMQQPTAPETRNPSRQQPTPDPDPQSQPAPDPSSNSRKSSSSATQSNSQAPSTQSFTGTIAKDGDNFTLKVSGSSSYKLDNDQQVQQYQGQRVRVTGTLDQSINLIHVEKIEPLT